MVRIIKILGLHYISTGPYPVCRVTEAAFSHYFSSCIHTLSSSLKQIFRDLMLF